MSDEVCGYLRHIESGTCVGSADGDQRLIADEFSLCSESHLFCVNTKTQIIKQDSSQSKVGIGTDPKGDILNLKLMTNDCTTDSAKCKWRLKERGKIQQGTSNGTCWQRNDKEGLITIATRNSVSESAELGNQQFDFQSQRESENSGNY